MEVLLRTIAIINTWGSSACTSSALFGGILADTFSRKGPGLVSRVPDLTLDLERVDNVNDPRNCNRGFRNIGRDDKPAAYWPGRRLRPNRSYSFSLLFSTELFVKWVAGERANKIRCEGGMLACEFRGDLRYDGTDNRHSARE